MCSDTVQYWNGYLLTTFHPQESVGTASASTSGRAGPVGGDAVKDSQRSGHYARLAQASSCPDQRSPRTRLRRREPSQVTNAAGLVGGVERRLPVGCRSCCRLKPVQSKDVGPFLLSGAYLRFEACMCMPPHHQPHFPSIALPHGQIYQTRLQRSQPQHQVRPDGGAEALHRGFDHVNAYIVSLVPSQTGSAAGYRGQE